MVDFTITSWYTGDATYDVVLALAFVLLFGVIYSATLMQSPYGRFTSSKFGPAVSARLGWFIMELPSSVAFLYFFLQGERSHEWPRRVMCIIFLLHYLNRGFFFPYMIRVPKGSTPNFTVFLFVFGMFVTTLHGYLNGTFFGNFGEHLTEDWLSSKTFKIGVVSYYTALSFNIYSDGIIRSLRTKKECEEGTKTYRIPYGGLFDFVTNASYFSELWAWASFAVFTWSPAGLWIFLISCANLIPRAVATHEWYKQKFENYPRHRKILIPHIW